MTIARGYKIYFTFIWKLSIRVCQFYIVNTKQYLSVHMAYARIAYTDYT